MVNLVVVVVVVVEWDKSTKHGKRVLLASGGNNEHKPEIPKSAVLVNP